MKNKGIKGVEGSSCKAFMGKGFQGIARFCGIQVALNPYVARVSASTHLGNPLPDWVSKTLM